MTHFGNGMEVPALDIKKVLPLKVRNWVHVQNYRNKLKTEFLSMKEYTERDMAYVLSLSISSVATVSISRMSK